MEEFIQNFFTALVVCLGYLFWIPVKTELIPDLKMMGWWNGRKWAWISAIIAFYIALIILLVYIWHPIGLFQW